MLSPCLFFEPNIIIRISPAKSCILRKCKWPVIFQGKNKWAAWTLHYLFTQPSKWTVILKKKIKLTVNSEKWVEYVPHFWRLKCGPIRRSQRKSLSTQSTNDSDIISHWIYIQRPASIFNLSSSSSSATGTTCSRLLLSWDKSLKGPTSHLPLHSSPPLLHSISSSPPLHLLLSGDLLLTVLLLR